MNSDASAGNPGRIALGEPLAADAAAMSRAVMSSLAAGLVIQDIEGTIVACNTAAERLLGLTEDQMTGRSSLDPRWRAVRADGSPFPGTEHPASVTLATGRAVRDVVMGVHRPDGTLVWILINAEPLLAGDALTGVVVSFTDVTELRQSSLRLASAGKTLQATLDSQTYPHVLLRPVRDEDGVLRDFVYVAANRAAAELSGRRADEMIGCRMLGLHPGMAPWLAQLGTVLDDGQPLALDEVHFPHSGGRNPGRRRYDVRVTAFDDLIGLTFADVTDRYQRERALARSAELLRGALDSAAIGIALITLNGRFTFVNEVLCEMLDCTPAELVQRGVEDLVEPELFARILAEHAQVLDARSPRRGVIEGQLRKPAGGTVWAKIGYSLLRDPDGKPEAYLSHVENLTAERQVRQELAYQTFHDTLTGLRNRAWIQEILQVELATASATSGVGLLLIDVDHFKLINDSLSHSAGDEFLVILAQRLAAMAHPGSHFARVGGDEFAVVLTGVTGSDDLNAMALAVTGTLCREVELRGQRIRPTVSIGIAKSGPGSTQAQMFQDADAALFRAKDQGRARWLFSDAQLRDRAAARLRLQTELREGLENGEVVPHFQPIISLGSGTRVGFEALARWNHPERGLLTAAAFIAEAEASDLIIHLGRSILTGVCRVLHVRPDLQGRVSINISAVQLAAPDWAQEFDDILGAHRVDPTRLIVEVTETAALSLPEAAREHLERIRALGAGVHVDDFGTGFSSISLLRELPVTGLKLDASFVRDLTSTDSPANALSAGLAGLARGLGLEAVAEGVETRAQSVTLLRQGWTHGQGWLFGRPADLAGGRPDADPTSSGAAGVP